MRDPDTFKATSSWRGAVLFFLSEHAYLDAANEHAVWLNLQAPDLRKKFVEGTFVPDSDDAKALELARYKELKKQFWSSFMKVAAVALLALIVGAWMGTVNIALPFHIGHVFGFGGAFLIAWAALFELGGPRLSSWDGKTLSEIVHPAIFEYIFLPGALVTLISVVL